MKWIAIAGSWRFITWQLLLDVKNEVAGILKKGNSIITGGALGVDYQATQLVLKKDQNLSRLKVFLPTNLQLYLDHYYRQASQGVINHKQADMLNSQLRLINQINPEVIISGNHRTINRRTYYLRNKSVVDAASELIAFQVNSSLGTQHAINYAKKLNKPTKVFKYLT